jgi:hypothetical protein
MKQFDFSTLKTDRSMKYLHDRYRQGARSGERFVILSEPIPRHGVLFRSRSIKEIRTAKNYLSEVWGRDCQP